MKNLDIKNVSVLGRPYLARKNSKEYSYFRIEYKNQLTENGNGDLIVYNSIPNEKTVSKVLKKIKESMTFK